MQTRSFISVPIIYKGESLGILLVDNPKSGRKLNQSDLNLLLGIAPQIAISINNAISYKKIRESEERFRSLSSNSPDIIYTIGIDGAFTYVNPAWERILGHRTEEVIGHFFIEFVKPEEIPQYKRIFKETRDQKKTIRDLTGTILHQNGSERYFSLSGAPNLDAEGKVIGLVGTFKDITDRQLAEEALQYPRRIGKTDYLHLHALYQFSLRGYQSGNQPGAETDRELRPDGSQLYFPVYRFRRPGSRTPIFGVPKGSPPPKTYWRRPPWRISPGFIKK